MSDEISAEIKEAYQIAASQYDTPQAYLATLADAYVRERAGRRESEWKRTHRCAENPDWGDNSSHTHCADPRHAWTLEQWIASVEAELNK